MASVELRVFEYELFIVHAEADGAFVHGHLLPALGISAQGVLLSSALRIGAPIASEIERGVRTSRLTVAVLTPAYITERWTTFGEQLAGHANGAEGNLVPLLLADCEVPLRLDFLVALDFRDPDRWATEARRLRDRLAQPDPEVVDLPCPYPGMRPYTAEHAASFHGREPEIDEIVDRLRAGEREIYVIGPSGSGKSSLVTAGVLPRLARGVSGLGDLVLRSLQPGDRPTERLAQVLEGDTGFNVPWVDALLARHTPATRLVLVIDQLEELFLLAGDGERARFLAALRALRGDPRCMLVHTLRADCFGAVMESALWADLQGRISRVELAPLRGEELRAAIEQPARDLGVYFEPELIERLLGEAASEPGVLPLLQEVLVQLWDRRRLQLITRADYQAIGDADRSGLAVAIARRADAALRALPPAQTEIARRILLRLVSFGEGRADTRRQQPRAALRAAEDTPADFDAVLRRLTEARLITIDGDAAHGDARVDLAHEVMISAWPALAGWTATYRVSEQRRRRLEAAATAWIEHGCGVSGLLDEVELEEAAAFRQTESARALGENLDVAAFVIASRTALQHLARERQERQAELEDNRKRLRHLLAQSYQEQGRRLLLDREPMQALPYLVAARREGAAGPSLRMLFRSATSNLPIARLAHLAPVVSAAWSPDGSRIVTISGTIARSWNAATGHPVTPPLPHEDEVSSAAWSPDGRCIVTASKDRTVRVWKAATGQPITPPLRHASAVNSATFSPCGTRIVIACDDRTAGIWDAATGVLAKLWLAHDDRVKSAAFSPDGRRILTVSCDKTAQIWDAETGHAVTLPLRHAGVVSSAAFSPDGRLVVTASRDSTARIWDAATGDPVTAWLEHAGIVNSAAFSPDGMRVVTASDDRTARIWDVASGQLLKVPVAHKDRVMSAAFDASGIRIVTASWDGTARIWDVETGQPVMPPIAHDGPVSSAAFSPDGSRIVTASRDANARISNVVAGSPITPPLAHEDVVYEAAFSPDGRRIVTASGDKTAGVWDAMTGRPVLSLAHEGAVNRAAWSPDGRRIVTASSDGTAGVWDAATGKALIPRLVHDSAVNSAVFSSDGARVVTASGDGTASVWNAATGEALTPPLRHDGPVKAAVFSPGGSHVITASADNTARVWEAATGTPVTPPLAHEDVVNCAVFSSDGTRVVTASRDNTARVWDVATGRPVTPPLAHENNVGCAVFSPDGRRILTASADNTARVWDAATGMQVTPPLAHQGCVNNAAFSPDGSRIVTVSADRTTRVWDAATGKPLSFPLAHEYRMNCVAFSSDGSRIVTAGWDKTARIWDVSIDPRTLVEWSALIDELCPYVLVNEVLLPRALRAEPVPVPPRKAADTATATARQPGSTSKATRRPSLRSREIEV
jgi:WD40 repeat protein